MKNKGITLIALIITIIILIILAGVTITALSGENGILTKTMNSKEKIKEAEAYEKLELAVKQYVIDKNLPEGSTTTLYYQISQIEGIEGISEEICESFPIPVTVDGYKFEINEDLTINRLGKGEAKKVPTIELGEYSTENTEELKIMVKAVTKDSEGIEKITLSYVLKNANNITNEMEMQKIEIGEGIKNTEKEISITSNGKYRIRVYGRNGTTSKIKEIEINNISESKTIATIVKGEVIATNLNLTITGKTSKIGIKKIEVYAGKGLVKTYEYDSLEKEKTEIYTVENLAFYGTVQKYYAKIIEEDGIENSTNIEEIQNLTDIKTETDLKMLASKVNSGNTFSGKIINQVANINLDGIWTPIGVYKEVTSLENKIFSGIYNGNSYNISKITINNQTKAQGLFAYSDGKIKNINIKEANIISGEVSGILIGFNRGIIQNCTVSGILKTEKNDAQAIGGIAGVTVGKIENCSNTATITAKYIFIGGIVGKISNNDMGVGEVSKCSNKGIVTGFKQIGGIAGYNEGNISNCNNTNNITRRRL